MAPIVRIDEEERPLPLSGNPIGVPTLLARLASLSARGQEVADMVGLGRVNRIVSIVAPGGMEKTSVAIATASQLREKLGDGIGFVELGLIEDPIQVRDALAVALGLPSRNADPFTDIVGYLNDPRMLILMVVSV